MAMDWDLYEKLNKISNWAMKHYGFVSGTRVDSENRVISVYKREGADRSYSFDEYSSVAELAAAIAEDFGFENDWGQRGSKRGKYYFFNMANEWEDTIIGNLTNDGYQEIEYPDEAEKTSMSRAVDGISDWIAECGYEGLDAKAFVSEALKNGSASRTLIGEEPDDEYKLTLTVVNDPSEYEYFS